MNCDQSKLIQVSKGNVKKKKGVDYDMQGNITVALVEVKEKTQRYLNMKRSKGD